MARSRSQTDRPRDAEPLRTYDDLFHRLEHFAHRRLPCLWISGPDGTGKSCAVRCLDSLDIPYLHQPAGNITPLRLYAACWRHRNQPIVLDDCMRHVAVERSGRASQILYGLSDTTLEKTLAYDSSSRRLRDGDDEIPPRFTTTSPVCIISNDFTAGALISRFRHFEFAPSIYEMHRYAATWFWSQEVHDFIGQNLWRLKLENFSQRLYRQGWDELCCGGDWRGWIQARCGMDERARLVQDLEADTSLRFVRERAQRYVDTLRQRDEWASLKNYYEILKTLREAELLFAEPRGSIRVCGCCPESLSPSSAEMDAVAAVAAEAAQIAAQEYE